MSVISCYETNSIILMEGALGERLKREDGLQPDVIFANIMYSQGGKHYLNLAKLHLLLSNEMRTLSVFILDRYLIFSFIVEVRI